MKQKQNLRYREQTGRVWGAGVEGRMEQEVGVSSEPSCIEWINKILFYSTKNYIQYPMTNHTGEEYICVLVPESCPTLCDPMECSWLLCPWNSSGKDTGVGCHFLHQVIFPTQGSNPSLLHWRQILHIWATREWIKLYNWITLLFNRN